MIRMTLFLSDFYTITSHQILLNICIHITSITHLKELIVKVIHYRNLLISLTELFLDPRLTRLGY